MLLPRYYVPNPAYNAGCCGRPPKPAAKAAGAGKPGPDVESGDGAAAAAAGTFEPLEVPAKLELLKGITGYAVPGELMALMGGSGAGECVFWGGGGVRMVLAGSFGGRGGHMTDACNQ